MMLTFGQEWTLDYFGSYEAYKTGYLNLMSNIETFNFYFLNIIIAIFILFDLKAYKKLIGIPILTAIIPIYGVSLFMIHQYYLETKN